MQRKATEKTKESSEQKRPKSKFSILFLFFWLGVAWLGFVFEKPPARKDITINKGNKSDAQLSQFLQLHLLSNRYGYVLTFFAQIQILSLFADRKICLGPIYITRLPIIITLTHSTKRT